MHIPEALYRDTQELPVPRSALVLPSAIFPLLVLVLPFLTMGQVFGLHWGWWAGGFALALGWAVVAGFLARSPKPWRSAVRLLGWAVLWCAEPFVVLLPLGVVAEYTHISVVAVVYLGGAVAFGCWLFRRHRGER
ncbi:hypothetical protein SAMN05216188_103377 [Lentzea xinjiangensis]|uniref:Uncharacterized protein n=1 Tax=Lentzea xinjiangensis TaxID=402600 RepID=A0A1H9GV42_9PSEU|nr:hypothetical protein SAMN05216188_103377 [Lentzea xinjiangensis]